MDEHAPHGGSLLIPRAEPTLSSIRCQGAVAQARAASVWVWKSDGAPAAMVPWSHHFTADGCVQGLLL